MPRTVRTSLFRAVAAAFLPVATAVLLTAPNPARAASHEVQITDSAFGTAVLSVQLGDTVTWTNVDNRPHTVTSVDGTFDSGNMNEGAAFSFTFTEPGTYEYICLYHEEMQATIVVEPASAAATTDAAPAATAQGTPAATTQAAASAAASAPPERTGHGDHSQPDTAVPAQAAIPVASFMLIGLGLVGFAVGLMPLWAGRPAVASRPAGGWRR